MLGIDQDFSEPDLRIAGFSLWVCGRQFPDQQDYWDGNWLNVRARVEAFGGMAECLGPHVHLSEVANFVEQLRKLIANPVGIAKLSSMEPNISLALEGNKLGHVRFMAQVTHDHITQSHKFDFDIDQTYLGMILKSCEQILAKFPIRGSTSQ